MRANKQVIHGQLQSGAYEGADKMARTINTLGSPINAIANPLFRGNCREFAGGSASAGVRLWDCWKAGASGCSATLSSQTVTVSSGTVVTVIDGAGLTSGKYTLSQAGTAPMRVGSGPWFAGVQTVDVTEGSNVTIDFGTGTILRPKFEPGYIATPFVVPDPVLERHRLSWRIQSVELVPGSTATTLDVGVFCPVSNYSGFYPMDRPFAPMASTPSVTLLRNNDVAYWNGSSWSGASSVALIGASAQNVAFYSAVVIGYLIKRLGTGGIDAVLSAEL